MRHFIVALAFTFAIFFSAAFVAHAALPGEAPPQDRRIIVINQASKRIVGLYASPIDQNDWKFNMLTTMQDECHCVRTGDRIVADANDNTGYCRYDFMAVLADGRKAFLWNANVCVPLTWTITD